MSDDMWDEIQPKQPVDKKPSLDDILREILESYCLAHDDEEKATTIAEIKKALADEGYLPHVDSGKHVKVGDKLYITNGSEPLVRVDLTKFMTGQVWYDRFEKELPRAVKKDLPLIGYESKVLEAAKRAADIE